MNNSSFKIEKKNQSIILNPGALTVNEVASGIKAYLNEIADQGNYNMGSLMADFFTLIIEAEILDSRWSDPISI